MRKNASIVVRIVLRLERGSDERSCSEGSLQIAEEWRNCGLHVDGRQIAFVTTGQAISEVFWSVG